MKPCVSCPSSATSRRRCSLSRWRPAPHRRCGCGCEKWATKSSAYQSATKKRRRRHVGLKFYVVAGCGIEGSRWTVEEAERSGIAHDEGAAGLQGGLVPACRKTTCSMLAPKGIQLPQKLLSREAITKKASSPASLGQFQHGIKFESLRTLLCRTR